MRVAWRLNTQKFTPPGRRGRTEREAVTRLDLEPFSPFVLGELELAHQA